MSRQDVYFLVGLLIMFAIIFGFIFLMDYNQCRVQAGLLNVEFEWRAISFKNCRVSFGDLWVPIDNYRVGPNE